MLVYHSFQNGYVIRGGCVIFYISTSIGPLFGEISPGVIVWCPAGSILSMTPRKHRKGEPIVLTRCCTIKTMILLLIGCLCRYRTIIQYRNLKVRETAATLHYSVAAASRNITSSYSLLLWGIADTKTPFKQKPPTR